ncbi:MAG: hybrid sensor histidine kinase/response regulator [Pirellulales bacterium]
MNDNLIRLLIVDDDVADVELATHALSKSKRPRFAMESAGTLADALDVLRTMVFDAVLLDLNLTDSWGLPTLQGVRAQCPDVPIVVCSGMHDEETVLQAVNCGAQDYLLKGRVMPDMVVRSVVYAIQRQNTERKVRKLLEQVRESEHLLREKNERLAQLNEVAHQVVDNVSHEFRTPLTVIHEYAALMKDGVGGTLSEDHQRFVEIISDRTDDLAVMVDDLLDVSRIEAGLLAMARKSCRVHEIVDHVRVALERKAKIRKVELQIDVPADLPLVFCDPDKVGRILTNLAVNAIKFAGEPGCVRITAHERHSTGDVVIDVADNGPGIDEAGMAVIFNRFRQLPNQGRGSTKGFGLGLNIARELVEHSFGELTVDTRVGEGSTFSFSLPTVDPAEIVHRYLQRLARTDDESQSISLLVVSVADSVDNQGANDVDALFTYLQRRNDLLLRLLSHRWLLLLDAGRHELDGFRVRLKETLAEVNRNRLRGPLPALNCMTIGTWALSRRREIERKAEDILALGQPVGA